MPVVSTRCGGPEEFVIPGVTGSLVGEDPQEMANAIATIFEDRELRLAMSRAARALVQERYSAARADAVFAQAFKAAFSQPLWAKSVARSDFELRPTEHVNCLSPQ